jgi:polyferredoxin
MGKRLAAFSAACLLLFSIGGTTIAQDFGSQSSFGDSSVPREFRAPTEQDEAQREGGTQPFLVHDQLTKFLLILGFTVLGFFIVFTRRFALRRWLLLTSVIALGFIIGGLLCPISAVQNVILKAGTGYVLMFLVPSLTAVLAGRLFCGYVCPFGALQELVHLRRFALRIPERWMRILRWIPFALLSYLAIRALVGRVETLSGWTPFKAFFTYGGTSLAITLSSLFVVSSIFVFRPFCRVLCPLGAWLSLVSRLTLFNIRVGSQCVSCNRCEESCDSGAIENGRVRFSDCLLCGECIHACPVRDLRFTKKRSRSPKSSSPPQDS